MCSGFRPIFPSVGDSHLPYFSSCLFAEAVKCKYNKSGTLFFPDQPISSVLLDCKRCSSIPAEKFLHTHTHWWWSVLFWIILVFFCYRSKENTSIFASAHGECFISQYTGYPSTAYPHTCNSLMYHTQHRSSSFICPPTILCTLFPHFTCPHYMEVWLSGKKTWRNIMK